MTGPGPDTALAVARGLLPLVEVVVVVVVVVVVGAPAAAGISGRGGVVEAAAAFMPRGSRASPGGLRCRAANKRGWPGVPLVSASATRRRSATSALPATGTHVMRKRV